MKSIISFTANARMKHYHLVLLFGGLLLSGTICAQNEKDTAHIVGYYKATPNQQDSLKVYIKDSKWACIEYQGICKLNQINLVSYNLLCAKNRNITELVEALVYLKDKAIEWNRILETRNIYSYEKDYKEVSFPRLDLYLTIQNETYHLWINKHLIKRASFIKTQDCSDYKIVLYIIGSGEVDHGWHRTISFNDRIELNESEINQLILVLRDAAKLCHEGSDIDNLLTE